MNGKHINKMNAKTRSPSNATDEMSILISDDQKTNSNRGTPARKTSFKDY